MSINIMQPATVKAKASELLENSNYLQSVSHSIDYILKELAVYWEQTQADAQSFSLGLKKNVEYLNNIVQYNKEFSDAIIEYIDVSEKISRNTIQKV